MRPVVIDLAGDPEWEIAARRHGANYVSLARTDFWLAKPSDGVVIVDGRGRHDASLELIAQLAPGLTRVLVTDQESPRDHERAYLAGTTRIVVLGRGEGQHDALIAEALAKGER